MSESDGCADPTNIGECLFIFIGICLAVSLVFFGLGVVLVSILG